MDDDVIFRIASQTSFGLGFSVVTDLGARGIPGSVGEFGWLGAYHSVYWVDPKEELVVVYLSQLIPAIDVDDQAKVRALISQYQGLVNYAATETKVYMMVGGCGGVSRYGCSRSSWLSRS